MKTEEKLKLHTQVNEACRAGMLGVLSAQSKVPEVTLRRWADNILKLPSFDQLAAVKRVCDSIGSGRSDDNVEWS